jgi:isopentenyl-diphosphate delta-isomerase
MRNHNIVSDPSEQLILVDSDDQEVGYLSKLDCHAGAGVMHRAFSIFLFNSDGEILMQRRSAGKPLWPLYWSNSCCSHPRVGESIDLALQRRMQEELGVQCPLIFLYKFQYQAPFGDLGSECEVCSVYAGTYDGVIHVNQTEIAEVRYATPAALLRQIERDPDGFTPWFRMELERISSEFQDLPWLEKKSTRQHD